MPNITPFSATYLAYAMSSADKTTGNLQSSLSGSGAVTALVLTPLIARAAALQADISALIDALNATE